MDRRDSLFTPKDMARFKASCEFPPEEKPLPDHRRHIPGVNGVDPMSPYDIPSSILQYSSIADVMNKKGFDASFPQSYSVVPGYFRRFNITPYFNPGADSDYAHGSLTIAGMIELTENDQPWQLSRDQDIDLIITIAEQYLDSIQGVLSDPRMRDYSQKVHRFLKVMRRGQERVSIRTGKVNPNAIDFARILKKMLGG